MFSWRRLLCLTKQFTISGAPKIRIIFLLLYLRGRYNKNLQYLKYIILISLISPGRNRMWRPAGNKTAWSQKLEYNLANAFLLYLPLLGTILAYPSFSLSLISLNARKRNKVSDLQILIPSHRKDSTLFTENAPQSSGVAEDFEP